MKTTAILSVIAIAVSMNVTAVNPKTSAIDASLFESINHVEETIVEVSDWMFNEEDFDTENTVIEIEDWMLNVDMLVEPTVIIEDWMLDDTLFEVYEETFAQIEAWMLNEEAFQQFEEIITITDWMLNTDGFCYQENDYEELVQIEEWMFDVESFR